MDVLYIYFFIFLFFLKFYIGLAKRLPHCVLIEHTSCKCLYSLTHERRVSATLWQTYAICKKAADTLWGIWQFVRGLPAPSDTLLQIVRGLPVPSDTLLQICQRVASTLWHHVTNLPEGYQYHLRHLREGCSSNMSRSYLFEKPLKKMKFKFKNKDATDSLIFYLLHLKKIKFNLKTKNATNSIIFWIS